VILVLAVVAVANVALFVGILTRARARQVLNWRVWLIPFMMLGADMVVLATVAHTGWLFPAGAALFLACWVMGAISARRSRRRSQGSSIAVVTAPGGQRRLSQRPGRSGGRHGAR
jgi:uncharacterized ion transporter superfamily protein YfcC